jgi:hypothetical protein
MPVVVDSSVLTLPKVHPQCTEQRNKAAVSFACSSQRAQSCSMQLSKAGHDFRPVQLSAGCIILSLRRLHDAVRRLPSTARVRGCDENSVCLLDPCRNLICALFGGHSSRPPGVFLSLERLHSRFILIERCARNHMCINPWLLAFLSHDTVSPLYKAILLEVQRIGNFYENDRDFGRLLALCCFEPSK